MCGCWLAPADQPLVSPSASTACVLGTLVSVLVKHLPGSRQWHAIRIYNSCTCLSAGLLWLVTMNTGRDP